MNSNVSIIIIFLIFRKKLTLAVGVNLFALKNYVIVECVLLINIFFIMNAQLLLLSLTGVSMFTVQVT